MKKIDLEKNTAYTAPLVVVLGILIAGSVLFFSEEEVEAQTSNPVAELIGGRSKGVSQKVCCNGVVLEFDSVRSSNPYIIDGEVLLTGQSKIYREGNELQQGFCSLGNTRLTVCEDPQDECAPGGTIPEIVNIGTSGQVCPQGF